MRSFRIRAPAKINFTLEVLGRRPDGYHEVRMLMASVSLCDMLAFEPWPETVLECDRPGLDVGASNSVLKAARLLHKRAGQGGGGGLGARIFLKKRIPLGAGLAGGSADAAAALRGLNRLWRLDLKPQELLDLAASLGSDIPFCLQGGWALATGRGEKLKRLIPRRRYHLVLLNPGFEVSTTWAYSQVRPSSGHARNVSRLVWEALDQGDLERVEKFARNDLEAVTSQAYPEIAQMRRWLSEEGAVVSRMSGSGPTVWGLFRNETEAIRAEKRLKNKVNFVKHVWTESGNKEDNFS